MELQATTTPFRHRLLREPRRPLAIRESQRAHWYVLATVCVGAFMGQLDASIVTLALPSIGLHLHASIASTEWVALAYLMALVCSLAAIGKLADSFGRKLLYVYGFAMFSAGSLACGLATNLTWLICARLLQGLGAAMLQANSVALITEAMPKGALGRALGIQGAAQASGLALGPVLGGLLLSIGGWRLLFMINLPAGAIGLCIGLALLPRSRTIASASGDFDSLGVLLLAAAVGTLMPCLSMARAFGYTSPALSGLAVMSVICAVAFWRREQSIGEPLIDPQLLRAPGLRIGLASGLVSYTVMFGTLLVVPYYLGATHTPFARAGLELACLPVSLGVSAALAGRAIDRSGSRPLTCVGMLLTGAGLLAMALEHDTLGLIVGLALAGVGLGAFTAANNTSIMLAAPRGSAGVISALVNTTRGLGTAGGVCLASLIYVTVAGISAHGEVRSSAAARGLSATLIVLGAAALGTAVLLRGHLGVHSASRNEDLTAQQP